MGKSDELDRTRAAAYAWRLFTPSEPAPAPEAPPLAATPAAEDAAREADGDARSPGPRDDGAAPTPGAEAAPSAESFRDESQRRAAILADSVERVWALPEADQAAAVAELALRADEMGILAIAMVNHPHESARLFRLMLRWWEWLPADAREAARRSLVWSDLSHPEIVEVLADAVKTSDAALHGSIALALSLDSDAREALSRMRGAGARFARLLDEVSTPYALAVAVELIGIAGQQSAVQALRRALRRPHFVLRWRALECLNDRFSEAIEPGDVLFLLQEAVDHAPPWEPSDEENRRANRYFPRLLARLIARLRPAGAPALLARLVDGACDARFFGTPSLDAAWAFGVLATTFPEDAAPRIDAHLHLVDSGKRMLGAVAAGCLPDDLAWPRLLVAAADPVPEIASLAQSTWLSRRGSLCRFDELAGIEVALLAGPPSEQMRARIPILRTGPLAARAAMAEVLLAEAPDPEALVLLLFVMGDEDLWDRKPREGLPDSRKGFARAVVERFGAHGVLGLVALAERYADDKFRGFVDAIADLIEEQVVIPEACYPALRALALRRIDEAPPDFSYDALLILAHVGAPAELAPRLAAVAWSTDLPSHVVWAASRALATAGRDELGGGIREHGAPTDSDVDALLLGELSAALAAADLSRFARAIRPAVRRRLPAAIEMAERAIERLTPEPEEDPAVVDVVRECIGALAEIDRGPAVYESVSATAPGTVAFALACRRVREVVKAPADDVRTLVAAFAGPCASAAVEAALALLCLREIEAKDPRLPALAERVPLLLRAELLANLLRRQVPARPLWPLIEQVLVSPDPRVTDPLIHHVFLLDKAGLGAELCAVEPRVVDPKLRADFEEWLYFKGEGAPYWQDDIEATTEDPRGAEEQDEGG